MGAVISLITQAINFGKQVTVEVDREKNRKLQKEADRLSNPIKPPQPWETLAARKKNVLTGPYTVEGIRTSLSNQILPAGYAEEQLISFGFGSEVAEYRQAVDADRKKLLSSFGQTLQALANAIRSELTGQDLPLRRALALAGISNSTVSRFEVLSREAAAGDLEPAAVSSAISELKTLLDRTQLQKDVAGDIKESQKQITAASAARGAATLGLLRRALRSRPALLDVSRRSDNGL